MVKNKIQLITYPDSLGNDLKDLNFVLNKYFKDIIGGVHILPFYPSSTDRGFAPLTQEEVDPKFGDWENIKEISKNFEIMVDFVMNHVSSKSFYFQHYMMFGEESFYKDMFIRYSDFFKNLSKSEIDRYIKLIYRPRPSKPFITIHLPNKKSELIWTTFSPDQIDVNWETKITKKIMKRALVKLQENGVKYLRLDAAAYTSKKIATSCFFNKESYNYINWVKRNSSKNMLMLPEVHTNYNLQLELSKKCDLTYDFQSTLLILNSIYFKDSKKLKDWIRLRPDNLVTVLDTHDGIGIVDGEGLLSQKELKAIQEKLFKKGGKIALRATGKNSDNLDVYQINCTYYSALNNDNAYLLARAIQFFLPGIPQVYYVGFLAGKNDVKLLEKTGIGRDINRHFYSLTEIEKEIQKPIVKQLIKLMKFRNFYPAFNGKFKLLDSSENTLVLYWKRGKNECILNVDFLNKYSEIKYTEIKENKLVWKKFTVSLPIPQKLKVINK